MIVKRIRYSGQPMDLACDARCDQAFGIQARPRRQLSAAPDDYVFVPDAEVGTAPGPGDTAIIAEGECMKPSAVRIVDPKEMNKWCARQCERRAMVKAGDVIRLPDMNNPTPNMPQS